MYFYQSKEALRLTLAATLSKFDRVMQLAAIARKYDLTLANNADYEKAMFELILKVSRHQKFKLSFLQRSVCAIRQNSRLSGHVRTISENDLEYLADQIRNEPLFAGYIIHAPEKIQKRDLDVLPEYLKEIIISGRKRAEIPNAKGLIEPRRADGKEKKLPNQQDGKVSRFSDWRREFVSKRIYKKGDVIDGKYDVYGTLGKGGYGIVYLVYARNTHEAFALKTFRDELLADPVAREAFKKEALLWINLEMHPYILAAQWVDNVDGRLFVSMEYIAPDAQGRVSLADHLSQAQKPIATDQSLIWAIQFCLGMEHAISHGIKCHRDIKPANILITQDGTLKISDFGLATAAEVAWRGTNSLGDSLVTGDEKNGFGFSLMQAGGKVRCGTPGYIAPEVYRYEGADIRSDIYSFGLVLWQMTTGSQYPPFMVPWRGHMESYLLGIYDQQMAGRFPRMEVPLGSVIESCLRPSPSERFCNFQELRGALDFIWKKKTGRQFELPRNLSQTAAFWLNKGFSLSALGRHEEAIVCFDKALAIDPRFASAWYQKGKALDELGRHKDAIVCYDSVLAIDPQDAHEGIWNLKSNDFRLLGRHEEAISCLDKVLEIDPQDLHAWNNKCDSLQELGRHKDAIACCNKALAIDPRDARAWDLKGKALHKIGRHDEAIDCRDRVLAYDPVYYLFCIKKDLPFFNYEDQIRSCNKVLAIDPQATRVWSNKGFALLSLGQLEEAIVCYDSVLAIDPRDAHAWDKKGKAFQALGRLEKAIFCHDKALEINPQYADAWLNKGAELLALDRHEEAILCFNKALAIDPFNKSAWYNKALSEDALKRRHEAVNSFQKFVELASQKDAKIIAYARQRLHELKSA